MNYIDTVYNKKDRPLTTYPEQLAKYLFDRYQLKSGMKILDLGCGRGEFSIAFKKLELNVFSCDREPSDFHKGLNIKYFNAEHGFHYANNFFDVIFSKSVIEHIKEPDAFMKNYHDKLKYGGRAIILCPDWHSQHEIFYNDHTHVKPYTTEALRDFMIMYKFYDVKAEKFYQLPILWKYPKLKIISKLLQLVVPVRTVPKNKFIRWSIELMILAEGTK
jgi:cyclopropane fatty-acyl-phospholipid synthase-like methyltransferase